MRARPDCTSIVGGLEEERDDSYISTASSKSGTQAQVGRARLQDPTGPRPHVGRRPALTKTLGAAQQCKPACGPDRLQAIGRAIPAGYGGGHAQLREPRHLTGSNGVGGGGRTNPEWRPPRQRCVSCALCQRHLHRTKPRNRAGAQRRERSQRRRERGTATSGRVNGANVAACQLFYPAVLLHGAISPRNKGRTPERAAIICSLQARQIQVPTTLKRRWLIGS